MSFNIMPIDGASGVVVGKTLGALANLKVVNLPTIGKEVRKKLWMN